MSGSEQTITPALLRNWRLPAAGDSKYGRGQVVVVGGAAGTPGGALLAGLAALRVGAGHLSLGVAESVASALAVAFPEAGVTGLPQTAQGSVRGAGIELMQSRLAQADVVLVGPGLDDADETLELLKNLLPMLGDSTQVVLDAYALGVLPDLPEAEKLLAGRWSLTPNSEEAGRLLGKEIEDTASEVSTVAETYGAVVSCGGSIADTEGNRWTSATGHPGLATSGSGDVLAGAVAGLLARGATHAQAACWGTYLHAAAGDRLAARVGPLGFLARELLDELPLVLVEVST